MLVRLRLLGGRVPAGALGALADAAEEFGDGRVHVTSRANLQVRGFPGSGGRLDPRALTALRGTGLLPSPTHELVRNIMLSPGLGPGGRADLLGQVEELDERLCADADLASLPGRFLFVLDDGRGDLLTRGCDLGVVALDPGTVQLRVGPGWGDTVPVAAAAARLVHLARSFVQRRGAGGRSAWHVSELRVPLVAPRHPDPRVPAPAPPPAFGAVPGGRHVQVPAHGLDRAAVRALTAAAPRLTVTPWRGILVPEAAR